MRYSSTDDIMREISDHWEKSKDSNLYKVIDVFSQPLLDIATESESIAEQRSIKEAKGNALTLMGRDRNTIRNSNDDELFRFLVYIKTLLGQADGTFPKIADIANTALNSTDEVKIIKTGTHHISISLPLEDFKDSDAQKIIIKSVSQLTALGIWLDNFIFESVSGKQLIIQAATTSHKAFFKHN